jgi:RNA polymerase sigma-70 factor, ECF subfamily
MSGQHGRNLARRESESLATAPNSEAAVSLPELIAEHTGLLYRYAYRLSGSASDADDLVQQTFLLAQQNLSQLREASAAKAWLCALLRSAFGRQLRQATLPCVSLDELPLDIAAEEPVSDFPEIDSATLQQALNRMPSDYRLVVVGFYFEACSYQELATRLEIPLGTVMSRLSRAKRWLREQLLPLVSTEH